MGLVEGYEIDSASGQVRRSISERRQEGWKHVGSGVPGVCLQKNTKPCLKIINVEARRSSSAGIRTT